MKPATIIADFNNYQRAINMARVTIEWQEVLLWRFLSWLEAEGVKNLTAVDHNTMARYQVHVSGLTNKKGDVYDPRVQNGHITAVRKLYRHLRLKGHAALDPTAGMRLARKPKKLPKSVLSVAEVELLLEQPDTGQWLGVRDRAMLEVLYSTAMRRSELLKLDLNDLNPDDGTILIREGKYSRDRVVPCGKVAWRWLKEYVEQIRPLHVCCPEEQAVFVSLKGGGRLGNQGLKGVVDYCTRLSGIRKRVTPHSLRHSAATHMSSNGADIAHIQALLGHARADSTAVYIHIAIRHLKKVHSRCHPGEKRRRKRHPVNA